jgi:hypothetical protein
MAKKKVVKCAVPCRKNDKDEAWLFKIMKTKGQRATDAIMKARNRAELEKIACNLGWPVEAAATVMVLRNAYLEWSA